MMYNDFMSDLQNYQFSDAYTLVSPEFRISVNNKYSISNDMMINSLKKLSPENMLVSNNGQNLNKAKNKNNINFNNFRDTCIDLMSRGRIMGVFGGSIEVKQITSIINYLEKIIKPMEPSSLRYKLTNDDLSAKTIKINNNPNNSERAIGYGIYLGNMREVGDDWKIKKPMCSMLEIFIADKFSASVRTEKQVGYVAICNIINVNEQNNPDLHLVFTVQSTRDDAFDIVKDYVTHSVLKEVEQISENDFESMKQSIITKLSEKPNNIREDCDEFFASLNNTYDTNQLFSTTDDLFITERANRKKIMAYSLRNIKRTDFVSFIQSVYKRGIYATIRIEPIN
jgi:secreted Zn-dependent insulinase-like peptidase